MTKLYHIATTAAIVLVLGAMALSPAHAQYQINPYGMCKSSTDYRVVKFCATVPANTCPYLDRAGSYFVQYRCDGVLNQLNHDRKCAKVQGNVAKRKRTKGKGPTKHQQNSLKRFCRRILD